MEVSKISLSTAEMKLVEDAQVILTKNSIIQKTVLLMADVQEQLLQHQLPHASPPPKISKGEAYRGLPYVVLDYPRISAGDDLFFIRSLFWWGNHFSSTLQLSGAYKNFYLQNLTVSYDELCSKNYFVGINPDPWQHHFEEDNYCPVSQLSQTQFSAILSSLPHIKIAAQWPLSNWDLAASKLTESWRFLTGLVT